MIKVLFIGCSFSGKLSLIQALLGEEIPIIYDLANTGIVTELVYGKQLRRLLYPRKESGIPEPLVLVEPTLKKIRELCSIDLEHVHEPNRKQPYERVVIECDNSLLKEGIALIVAPHMVTLRLCEWEWITERYFPRVDVLVYVMDAFHSSQDELKLINANGFRNPIIVYTHWETLCDVQDVKGEKIRQILRDQAVKYTTLGEKGVFFVSSIEAWEGKKNGDEEAVKKSGITDLENLLSVIALWK